MSAVTSPAIAEVDKMPIPIDLFRSGVSSPRKIWLCVEAIKFLKEHADQAYSLDDLGFELKVNYQVLRTALRSLTIKDNLDVKLVGRTRYYAYKESKPVQEPDPSVEQIAEEEKEDLPQTDLEDY